MDKVLKTTEDESGTRYAAIDLGSNSFHLAIGALRHGELRWQQRMSEKVQLAAGFNGDNELSENTKLRAFECLQRFHKRIAKIPIENIRIVGTNALRVIRNGDLFLRDIERLFQQRVEVISGREEARLIYLGVSHTNLSNKNKKFVIDIGGGSTEFIVGQAFQPILTESLHMGCVSFRERFFSNGKLTKGNFKKAVTASQQQTQLIASRYQDLGWDCALGASGSIKSILQVLQGLKQQPLVHQITLEDLEQVRDLLLNFSDVESINLPNLKAERFSIFAPGLAILLGAMTQLGIKSLDYSEGALREGLIYDLLGRLEPENIRQRTVDALFSSYSVDQQQAERVHKTALYIYKQFTQLWPEIHSKYFQGLLQIAAQLHEIGISISHTQFHKHGAYLLAHAYLAGFSRQEQMFLSCLVRLHRRKFTTDVLQVLPSDMRQPALYLSLMLRLAVLFNHSRSLGYAQLCKHVTLNLEQSNHEQLLLNIDSDWLNKNPLVQMDLETEAELLKKAKITLQW